ncbi:MAG: hypothetical protein RIM33_08600 [Alphaproteobacteria bacterium]
MQFSRTTFLACTMAVALGMAAPVSAKQNNARSGHDGAQSHSQVTGSAEGRDAVDIAIESVIDASTRAVFEDYFQANPQPIDHLPPGIARNVERGKPLPPGIARRQLPGALRSDLRTQTSTIGDVVDAVIVGNDVAILDAASGVVVEILRDIVRAQ